MSSTFLHSQAALQVLSEYYWGSLRSHETDENVHVTVHEGVRGKMRILGLYEEQPVKGDLVRRPVESHVRYDRNDDFDEEVRDVPGTLGDCIPHCPDTLGDDILNFPRTLGTVYPVRCSGSFPTSAGAFCSHCYGIRAISRRPDRPTHLDTSGSRSRGRYYRRHLTAN